MFGKLQRQMTILHTLILVSILAVTNLSVYFLLQSYNVSQMAREADDMLNSLQESAWTDEYEAEVIPQSIDVDDPDDESPSPLPDKDEADSPESTDSSNSPEEPDASEIPDSTREPAQPDDDGEDNPIDNPDEDSEDGPDETSDDDSEDVPDETPDENSVEMKMEEDALLYPFAVQTFIQNGPSFPPMRNVLGMVSAFAGHTMLITPGSSAMRTVSVNPSKAANETDAAPSENPNDASTAAAIKAGDVRTLHVPSVLKQFSFYLVFDLDGNLTSHNLGNRQTLDSLMDLAPDISAGSRPEVRELSSGPLSRALLLRRSIEIEGVRYGSYLVGRDLSLVTETMSNLLLILIISFIAGVLASILIGYLLAGRAIRPIREAYEAKQRFLADASHELRTPISVVLLSTESLDRALPEDSEEARADLTDIREEAFRMRDLVERLLFLARSDNIRNMSGKGQVDLVPLLNEVAGSLGILAKDRNIALEVRNPAHLVCLGDGKMLSTLFTVLTENAIKYNREGGRVIVEGTEIRVKRSMWVEIRVADTGIGIPESEQERIFQRFYRSDLSRSQQTGGHGLGLAIAKEIAEAHGGTVQVVSQPDIGTTFTVRLPAGNPPVRGM